LSKRLGEKLREKAEETGYLPEELGVELVSNSLNVVSIDMSQPHVDY
jgi:hypothetical protein